MKSKFLAFWSNPWNIYFVALFVAAMIVLMEYIHNGMENHIVFSDATVSFFRGISSYNHDFVDAHTGRYFLYLPLFHFFYAPFAYLPTVVGALAWNLFCCTLFFYTMSKLPGIDERKKPMMLLFMLPFLGQSLFEFQYNTVVCCLFLLAYILLERDHNFWAVLLIMFSVFTKVYGAVELALLLCYPRFWRNIGYAALCGAGFFLLPSVVLGFDGLLPWYGDWVAILTDHGGTISGYPSFVHAWPIRYLTAHYLLAFQVGLLLLLALLFLVSHKEWQKPMFRVGVLATLMSYVLLISETTEYCTYVIPASAIILWYCRRDAINTLFDKVVVWSFFVFLGIVPIDLFCPNFVCDYINTTLWIGEWVFAVLFGRIVYTTVFSSRERDSQYSR